MDMIITGATGGIGSCLVKKALQSPRINTIYCLYRREDKFRGLGFAEHPKIVPVQYDASDPEQVIQLVQKLSHMHTESIACVHTAFCIAPILRVGTYLPQEIKRNIDVNITHMVIFLNGLLAFCSDRKIELRIINIDSGAADRPLEGWGLYSASKAYTNLFLQTMRLENPDVKIVSYEPGVVDTPMQKEIRNTSQSVCAQAGLFQNYYDKGLLRSPDAVAHDLFVRFIENWEGTHFREGYQAE